MTVEVNIVVRVAEDTLLVPAGAVEAGRVFVVEDGGRIAARSRSGFRARRRSRYCAASRRASRSSCRRRRLGTGRGCGWRSGAMRLLTSSSPLTHILGRGRQTVVAGLGVALGVGFSVAMAALMQGSQDDFIRQLVDTMPHVEITDETRDPGAAAGARRSSLRRASRAAPGRRPARHPQPDRRARGARRPGFRAASRRASGRRQSSATRARGRSGRHRHRAQARGAGARRWRGTSSEGSFAALAAGGNNIVIGDTLAEKLGAGLGNTIDVVSAERPARGFQIVGLFHTGATTRDEGEAYVLLKNAQILAERAERRQRDPHPPRRPDAGPRRWRPAPRPQLGYKAVSWQEANESLMEVLVIRNVIMYTVVGAHPAGRRLRHLQHHLDHHPREGARHRDPEVARLPRERTCAGCS